MSTVSSFETRVTIYNFKKSISDGEWFSQALNSRFLCFAPISSVLPQNSCRFNPIYYFFLSYLQADSIILHFADDFGGQAFHLFGVIDEQVELDKFCSRIGDFAQTGNAS